MKRLRKIFVYLLALLIAVSSIPSTAFAEEEIEQASAVSMKMKKTEGTVKAADKNGKAVSVFKNMRLYDGYKVETLKNGYAWIDLDSSKLIKLDAYSKAAVQKSGKELDIILEKGKLFFNVAEPLAEDEAMSIRTSTTAVGIRGTCGWIEVLNKNETKISILEGTVQAAVVNPATGEVKVESVSGGETVTCASYGQADSAGKFDILRSRFSEKDVPGFVAVDIVNDRALVEKIFENSQTGVDLRRFTLTEAKKRLYTEQRIANNEPMVNYTGNDSESSGTPAPSASGTPESSVIPETPTTPTTPESPVTPGTPTTPDSSGTPETPGTLVPATYIVTFDSMGGSNVDPQNIASGNKAAKPADPAKAGYAFGGWYKENTYANKWDFDNDTVAGNMTLYAKWGNGNIADSGTTGPLTWSFYDTGVLTISGNGAMRDFNALSEANVTAPWYEYWGNYNIKEVVIESGVTNIGDYAFDSCVALERITIPSSVTSIGKRAFVGCSALESVTIPSGVTSIGESAFYSCRGLKSVEILSGVTSIGKKAFEECRGLTSVKISSGVTSIGEGAFYNCRGLKSIEIPSSMTSIGKEAFFNCISLPDVTIPSGVESIGELAFYGCSSLKRVEILSSVTSSIGKLAFNNCSALESVTISSGVTSIGEGAFNGCRSLPNITIPGGVIYIGNGAFSGCSSLESVSIPDSVTDIGDYAFSNCSILERLTIPGSVIYIGNGAFSGCSSLAITYPGTRSAFETALGDRSLGINIDANVTCSDYSPPSPAAFSFESEEGIAAMSEEGVEIIESTAEFTSTPTATTAASATTTEPIAAVEPASTPTATTAPTEATVPTESTAPTESTEPASIPAATTSASATTTEPIAAAEPTSTPAATTAPTETIVPTESTAPTEAKVPTESTETTASSEET